jgi:ureidoacrylate peracid hydrolase
MMPSKTLLAEPEPLEVDPQKTAVIVVDMQNAFVSEGGLFDLRGFDVKPSQRIVPTIQKICAAARRRSMKVIYIAHVLSHDLREVGPDSSFWYKSVRLYRENPQWQDKFMIRGTWGSRIIDALKPEDGDLLVEKPRFSAFYGTNLDGILQTCGLKNLLFVGCATNICVESSIRDGANLGYFPVLVSDATANNGPPFMQDAALFNVRLCFGWVSVSEKVLQFLQQ